ncbi:hypothetical protein CLV84_1890 [Neolewinella xylanilytica]|uniref:Tetratricopeptide repeat protein n=1 Tax=Neolewinella xylanilytica TaxID=1514080 RepID=A0A2S6IBS1_9BACT|nr:tetratricopeptide repeat protein [Neolewinella xylanilytica]PPK88916.1 hypothetical protein CLV84_1890 [Neolewinella xylanilytica]
MASHLVFLVTTLILSFSSGIDGQSDAPVMPVRTHATVAGLPLGQMAETELLIRAGRVDEAVALFDAMLAQQPDWVPALTARANLLHRLGRATEARRDQDRAMQLNPIAARFYGAKRNFSLLPFIALYPADWFDGRYYPGQSSTRPAQTPSPTEYRAERVRHLDVDAHDPIITFLRMKATGDEGVLRLSAHGFAIDQSEPWRAMMMGNLALLRQDLYQALQYYNDAELSGGNWPELRYNRGLVEILLNNLTNGCADLQSSQQAGYPPALEMLTGLCTY